MTIIGGFNNIQYSLKAASKTGYLTMLRTVFSKNTCKTCAFGMGGQKGGMINELGQFPQVCKKAFQAQITDIQAPIPSKLFQEKSINSFKNTSPRLIERYGRINSPLYKSKGDTHYGEISWEMAMDKIIQKFKNTSPERSFFYSSGRSSNEAAFLLQLFARLYGTNNVNNCSYYCHQASGVGMSSCIGSGTATIQLKDLSKADLIFVIGANPSSNHPRYMTQLMKCRRRGGKVIVINPAKEKGLQKFSVPSDFRSLLSGGSPIANEYLQVNINGDIALLKGIAKAVIESGKENQEFIKQNTNGYEEYVEDIRNTSWETIVLNSGIDLEKILEIANLYCTYNNVVFSWAMGITHHENGVENVESIVSLALLRAMVGKPNAGLLPLRGHSNVQGIGSVGVTPVLKEKILKAIEKEFEVELPKNPGMDTMECMQASMQNKVDFAFLLGGNLYSSNPHSKFAEEALNKIHFKVYLNTTLNSGHFYGVDDEAIILPVATRDEEQQTTTQESMFNFVRLSDGGKARFENVHTEVAIIAEIARGVLGNKPIDFRVLDSHEKIRKLISKTVSGFEKMKDIDNSKEEFQISGRTFHNPSFSTPDNKASFKVCPIREFNDHKGSFRMMSVRSEGQFNSIIYDEFDRFRGQTSRNVVMMNKDDISSMGLKENMLVNLKSSVGEMQNMFVRELDITPGNIMTYYPESNVLIPTAVDPRSKTPGYKLAWVKITPA
ncbi:MAG: histidine kinase [Marinilabiliales bacterium]|nr:MAG: histidine kinase [Marinilabiliales bacterium]